MLEKEPYAPAESLQAFLSKHIFKDLDQDLEKYVTSEPYYEPLTEEYRYNAESTLQECCRKMGVAVVEFKCETDYSYNTPDDW